MLKNIFFKTTNRKTEVLKSAIETYVVKWTSYGGYSARCPDLIENYQAFTDIEDAKMLKKSIEQAFELIKQDIGTHVLIVKQDNALK